MSSADQGQGLPGHSIYGQIPRNGPTWWPCLQKWGSYYYMFSKISLIDDSYGARSVPLLDATAYESWDPAIPRAQVPGYISMVIWVNSETADWTSQ